ncbi:formate dehydrogenase subunit delta [Paraburkholderia sp.]|uniref:formate dehydrogenase subunit delta n=1 Tax=Paraburkholderia sp. TaxID=1926495 RepID=UPI0023930E74|nr:formate dehydrogenase subunit delta [Paraburkholderia sp.]MDE1183566.1 formate dehydrogenase subunit delta [Paraburkholderia sp.]
MNDDNLIDMANRIGDFFASMPDHDEALAGIADHIKRFWEPRMRRALLNTLDVAPEALNVPMTPIVRETLSAHREMLMPAAAVA